MDLGWGSGNEKQSVSVVSFIKTRHKSACGDNGKTTQKEIPKLFSKHGVMSKWKCQFEEVVTESSTGKNKGFWLLRGNFKEYIKQNFTMAVLRKAISHSVDIYRMMKNQYYQ